MKSKDTILKIYDQYHDKKYLEWDPLLIASRFKKHEDLELVSLISALFAFGGVKQILASVEKALALLNCSHGGLVRLLNESDTQALSDSLKRSLKDFRHRIYIGDDLVVLLLLYRESLKRYGSLQKHFLAFHSPNAETIGPALTGLIGEYRQLIKSLPVTPGKHFYHMLNSPESKSACKRWVMYLKWMVRKDDGIDLGLWSEVRADQLIIPLDTHLFTISKRLKLTRRNTPNWEMALEVTRALKKIDPLDPTRFDFSLCRWGMFEYRKLHKNK